MEQSTHIITHKFRRRFNAVSSATRIPRRLSCPLWSSLSHSHVIYRCLKTPPKLMDLLPPPSLLPPFRAGEAHGIRLSCFMQRGIEYLELTKREKAMEYRPVSPSIKIKFMAFTAQLSSSASPKLSFLSFIPRLLKCVDRLGDVVSNLRIDTRDCIQPRGSCGSLFLPRFPLPPSPGWLNLFLPSPPALPTGLVFPVESRSLFLLPLPLPLFPSLPFLPLFLRHSPLLKGE